MKRLTRLTAKHKDNVSKLCIRCLSIFQSYWLKQSKQVLELIKVKLRSNRRKCSFFSRLRMWPNGFRHLTRLQLVLMQEHLLKLDLLKMQSVKWWNHFPFISTMNLLKLTNWPKKLGKNCRRALTGRQQLFKTFVSSLAKIYLRKK